MLSQISKRMDSDGSSPISCACALSTGGGLYTIVKLEPVVQTNLCQDCLASIPKILSFSKKNPQCTAVSSLFQRDTTEWLGQRVGICMGMGGMGIDVGL